MVELAQDVDLAEDMDEVFHALAHAARRDMLSRLAERDRTVGELSASLPMSLAAASKHVKILEAAGLVRRTIQGRRHVCRLEAAPLAGAASWLQFYERHWSARLDALEVLLRTDPEKERAYSAPPYSDGRAGPGMTGSWVRPRNTRPSP